MDVLDTIRAVVANQKRGGTFYRLVAEQCWCGGPLVLDQGDQPICLQVPFHDPRKGPVNDRAAVGL